MSIVETFQKFVEKLNRIYDAGEARSIARIVFEDAFHIRDVASQRAFPAAQEAHLQMIESRLLRHEPVQYILGVADFYGLKFNVNPHVLIPRQETEELVHWIIETIKASGRRDYLLLDIGTGSGCIPITLKKQLPELQTFAMDISLAALDVAETNAKKHDTDITFLQTDILDQNAWSNLGQFDIIVSNPPYIPHRERELMPAHVLTHEPELALFVANETPLLFYETIADFAKLHLKPGGWLFFECNEFNAQEVFELLKKQGFEQLILQKDLNQRDRMIRGTRITSQPVKLPTAK